MWQAERIVDEELGLAGRVGDLLGREDDVDVLLAERLEPALQAAGEDRMAEKQPRLVEDEQRRRDRRTALRCDERGTRARGSRPASPRAMRWPISIIVHGGRGDVVVVGVEDLAVVALDRVRAERVAERARLCERS